MRLINKLNLISRAFIGRRFQAKNKLLIFTQQQWQILSFIWWKHCSKTLKHLFQLIWDIL